MIKDPKKPKRGRPPVDGALTERTMVRLTPAMRAAWEALAAADGRPLGQWIRRTVNRAHKVRLKGAES